MRAGAIVGFLVCFSLAACHRRPDARQQLTELAAAFALVSDTNSSPSDGSTFVHAALAAVRQDNFAAGIIALQAAQQSPHATAEQRRAVQEAQQALTSSLVDRAARGDAAAQAALAAIERTRSQ